MKYLKAFFVFILPVYILLNDVLAPIYWQVAYAHKGVTYEHAVKIHGFPLPWNGIFYDLNGLVTSGNSTSNWTNFTLNQIFYLVISALLYVFLLSKIKFNKAYVIVITSVLNTLLYLTLLFWIIIFESTTLRHEYGIWPDDITILDIGYSF